MSLPWKTAFVFVNVVIAQLAIKSQERKSKISQWDSWASPWTDSYYCQCKEILNNWNSIFEIYIGRRPVYRDIQFIHMLVLNLLRWSSYRERLFFCQRLQVRCHWTTSISDNIDVRLLPDGTYRCNLPGANFEWIMQSLNTTVLTQLVLVSNTTENEWTAFSVLRVPRFVQWKQKLRRRITTRKLALTA